MNRILVISAVLMISGCAEKARFDYYLYNFSEIKLSLEETEKYSILKLFTLIDGKRLTYPSHIEIRPLNPKFPKRTEKIYSRYHKYRATNWKVSAGKHNINVDVLYDDKTIPDKNYDIASSTFNFEVNFEHDNIYVVNAKVEGETVTSWVENSRQERITEKKKNILSYYDLRSCNYICERITVSKFK